MRTGRDSLGARPDATEPARVRVGIDATPLLGHRTGIGRLVSGLLDGLDGQPSVEVVPFAMTSRNRRAVAPGQRPLPARPLRAIWERLDRPGIECWTGTLDVVHGTNYVVPPARCARLVSVHDLTALRYPDMCTPDVRRMPKLLRRSIDGGAHVHTDSHFVAGEVVDLLGADPARVHVVEPGLSADTNAMLLAAASSHPRENRPYLLALGTVEPRKDLTTLVRAFAELPSDLGVDLVIAGADGLDAERLAQLIASLPSRVRERIHRETAVNDDRRDRLLAHCAAFVYPSLYEGFGFPPLEAMAARRPVITTKTGSLPEVVGDAALLVEAGDPDALGKAITCVLTDSITRQTLIEHGVARQQQFTWDRACDRFASLYERLALA